MGVKITFELDPNNPYDKALINYLDTWRSKKKGIIVHELIRRCIARLCIEDVEWRALYCESIEVRVVNA